MQTMGQKISKEEIIKIFCKDSGIEPWFVAKIEGSPGVLYGAFHSEGINIYKLEKGKPVLTQNHIWGNFTEATIDNFFAKTSIILKGENHTTTLNIMEKGKDLISLLQSNTVLKIIILPRPWWRKILGFRSKTKWKMAVATIIYILFIGKVIGAFSGNGSTVPTNAPTSISEQAKTPDQKADDTKITDSDKELLKKSYASFDSQQREQFDNIKEKYKKLPNSEVADISTDFARLSTEEATVKEKEAYQNWVKDQFSAWDGSNTDLVDLVKKYLNDPSSFQHVETTYSDHGDYLIVKMTYRAKNAFGALILQNVTAKSDYKTNTISIISQND